MRSIKSECLSRIVPLGERHLRHAIREYVEHYHRERPHQGLGNALIDPHPANVNVDPAAPIRRRDRLGGMLRYYHRDAA